jgi:hypothetical protein
MTDDVLLWTHPPRRLMASARPGVSLDFTDGKGIAAERSGRATPGMTAGFLTRASLQK